MKKEILINKSVRKAAPLTGMMRELSEKELNEITKGVGELARAQTIEQKERLKQDLQEELASVRNAYSHHAGKNSKT